MSDNHQAVYDAVRSRFSSCDPQAAVYEAANVQLGGFSFVPQHIQQEVYRISEEMTRPSVLLKPKLEADGTMWCASYGDNPMSGVFAFGETPDAAMRAFDEAWAKGKTPAAMLKTKDTGAQP